MRIGLEKYRLAMISLMYFENGISQQEIASKLNLSKMTVSRMLQKAKDSNIIQINIQLPFKIDEKLSKKVTDQYGIENAVVIKKESTKNINTAELIGRVWAFYMGISLKNDYILGLGLGNTIGHTIRTLVPMNTKNVHILQLMGGLADVAYKNPFTIVQETCRKLNAQGTYVTSSVIVENKNVRDSIINDTPVGRQLKDLWKNCNEALFGIGTIEKGYILSPKLVYPQDVEKIKALGTVGDIMGHCFNAKGEFLKTHLKDRLVHIPLETFMNIPKRVALAGGVKKIDSIKGALHSGIITTLVTDSDTAELL